MTFAEYIQKVAEHHHSVTVTQGVRSYRVGQAYFNCLPGYLATDIGGTALDPFYDDSKIPQFLAYIEVVLDAT